MNVLLFIGPERVARIFYGELSKRFDGVTVAWVVLFFALGVFLGVYLMVQIHNDFRQRWESRNRYLKTELEYREERNRVRKI